MTEPSDLDVLRMAREDVYADEWMPVTDRETILLCLDTRINEEMKREAYDPVTGTIRYTAHERDLLEWAEKNGVHFYQ